MSIGDIIKSSLELAAIIFVVWSLFHEETFAALEEKLFAWIRRSRFKVIKGGGKAHYPRRKR